MRVALIEIGNTACRLTIDTGNGVDRRTHHLHLGASVSSNGSFTQDDISTATRLAQEFMTAAKARNCQRIVAIATESFRLAANGAAVASHISRESGCQIKILLPGEENALIWQAAADRFSNLNDLTTIALTGGSLGITSGKIGTESPEHNLSYPLGTSVLAPRASTNGFVETPTRVRLEHHIAESLKSVTSTIRQSANSSFIVTGGMPLALAKLIHTIRRSEVPESLDGLSIDCSDLSHLIKTFSELSTQGRLALPGMSPKRSELMPLGATILRQSMRSLEVHSAAVSTCGLKDALFARLIAEPRAA